MEQLKPCPFCGSTELKHYVNSATGGRYRGVIVCNKCGLRKEAYSDYTNKVADAYCGDWESADVLTREQARYLVKAGWNRRADECDRDELLEQVKELEKCAWYFGLDFDEDEPLRDRLKEASEAFAGCARRIRNAIGVEP